MSWLRRVRRVCRWARPGRRADLLHLWREPARARAQACLLEERRRDHRADGEQWRCVPAPQERR
jgi:hypothetical protein